MEQVAIITEIEKNYLDGELVQPDWYFNPILDCNDNWVISSQEIESSIYPQNDWVKQLSLIDWCKPEPTPPPPTGSTENV
jgi:hypothetical protein